MLNYKKPPFRLLVVAVVACIAAAVCFLPDPISEEEIKWSERPTLVMDGDAYVDPYMPVSELPYGYSFSGTLSQEQAHDTGLAGCKYYAHPDDTDSFFVFEECGTPIDENTVDSERLQWAYVRWIKEESEVAYARLLTLDDVRFLAKKGDSLMWSDFDGYSYIETGSGLYIRVYEIDERFSLMIGGGSTDESPRYIRLVSEANREEYVDIRTEDVESFIKAHQPDPLEAAVSAAILAHNESGRRESNFACESHVTLASVSATPKVGADTHEVVVYAMVLYLEYNITGGGIQEVSGHHIPTALTFEVDADGRPRLTEYWIPRDGGYYGPDIRDKFPADIVEDALDTQKYIAEQEQNCYAQAEAYRRLSR